MTSFTPNRNTHDQSSTWTAKDLFELASLDALGLLSDDERRSFESAFASAPPAVQEQLRDQQSRMAEIDAILPRVEPPASLRERVLAAVSAAIGGGVARPARLHTGGRETPKLLPSRGVSPLWRGLAIGCAAGMVALAVVAMQVFNQNREIDRLVSNNSVMEKFAREYGAKFQSAFLSPRTRFVNFTPSESAAAQPSRAVLLLDPETKSGQFFCDQLPPVDGEFRLVIVGPDGSVTGSVVATFTHSGPGLAREEVANLDLSGGKTLALVAPATDGASSLTLLRSTAH